MIQTYLTGQVLIIVWPIEAMSSLCNALTGISPIQTLSTDGFLTTQTKFK